MWTSICGSANRHSSPVYIIHYFQVKHCSSSTSLEQCSTISTTLTSCKDESHKPQQQLASSVSPEDCGDCVGAANVGCKSRLQKSRSWQHPTTYPFSTPTLVVSRHHKGNPGGKRTLLWKHLDRNSAMWADPCFYPQFSVFGGSGRCQDNQYQALTTEKCKEVLQLTSTYENQHKPRTDGFRKMNLIPPSASQIHLGHKLTCYTRQLSVVLMGSKKKYGSTAI